MSLSLQDLKKSSNKNLENLIKESEKLSGKENNRGDDRFWKPKVDSAGNFTGLIRFLPAPQVDGADALPWVITFDHGFKGPSGKWYIERSLTTIKKQDPVSEYNTKLWNSGDKDLIEQARAQKRKQSYISNILVINDPEKPENNGKVFLYRYGVKIFEKIKNIMTPDEELGEKPNDPFDFWAGQNFKLKIKKVAGYQNYDDSSFSVPSAISDDDNKIEDIWKREYSLKEFLNPANFKTYDELKARLHDVLEIRDGESFTKSAEEMAVKAEKTFEKETKLEEAISKVDSEEDADLEALLKEFD